jgi:hypothetical protein
MKKELIHQKLREIQDRVKQRIGIPLEEVEAYPTLKTIVKEAIKRDVPEAEELDALLNSGMLDKVEHREDNEQAQRFDKELTNEINNAIKSGELPDPRKIRDPFVVKMRKLWRTQKLKKGI